MHTRSQKVKHALQHFFFVYTVVLFMKVWFPTRDFFRGIWWKMWGHDPKADTEFHLGQISFDDAYFDRMTIGGIVHKLAKCLHGTEGFFSSPAWRLYVKYSRFDYLPLDQFEKIAAMWDHAKPGKYILEWFLTTDGISQRRVDYLLTQSDDFKVFYEEMQTAELRKPNEENNKDS